MEKIELHNPRKLNLPTLTTRRVQVRQSMEEDPTVKNYIRSKLLLDLEFNELCLDISDKSKQLLNLSKIPASEIFKEFPFSLIRFLKRSVKIRGIQAIIDPKSLEEKLANFAYEIDLLTPSSGSALSYERPNEIPKRKMQSYKGDVSKLRKKLNVNIRQEVIRLSNRISNSVSGFEAKNGANLKILSTANLFMCKKCSSITSVNDFKVSGCECGEKISKISRVNQIPIHYFNDQLIKFLESNYWFEHGVAHLLHKKHLETLVGIYVLGHSGVWHEIDIIAESAKNNCRFFCECKNTKMEASHVFILSGKMIDIGCTRGYIFTTSENVDTNIIRLARAKNIDIISNVLNKEKKVLLESIKEN